MVHGGNGVKNDTYSCKYLASIPLIPRGGPAVSFMNCLAGEGFFTMLLRFIRNVLVRDSAAEGEVWFHQLPQHEVAICCMINIFELFGKYTNMFVVGGKGGLSR